MTQVLSWLAWWWLDMQLTESLGVRFAEVHQGDDLRMVALRELGTAERWLELVTLNALRPPYIAAVASPGVLAYGDLIQVPSSSSMISASDDPVGVFGSDLLVRDGRLVASDGDLVLVQGVPNLSQALRRHVAVEKAELAFHPEFGCHVRSILGRMNGVTAGQLAAFYVKSALLEDERVDSVPSCDAEVVGDQIRVTATVTPISGRPVDMTLVV